MCDEVRDVLSGTEFIERVFIHIQSLHNIHSRVGDSRAGPNRSRTVGLECRIVANSPWTEDQLMSGRDACCVCIRLRRNDTT